MFNVQLIKRGTPILARQWAQNVISAGGGFEVNSMFIAGNLAKALQSRSYYPKIKYLLPMLGTTINAARVPLVDTLGVGTATNVSFVDADFSQSTGLQGNGSTKRFTLGFTLASLGSSNNGAIGYWCLNVGSPGWCIGSHTTDLFGLYLDSVTPREVSYWGDATNRIDTTSTAPTTVHYYTQRTSANLTLYRSGTQAAQTAGATVISNISATVNLMAIDSSNLSNGRCGLAYFTDGTMTNPEISDLHSLLSSVLMAPTKRI